MRNVVVCMLLLVLVSAAADTWAQGRPNLVVEIQVEREVYREDAQGGVKATREQVQETSQDDVLVYTLRWRNAGDGVARGAAIGLHPADHASVQRRVARGGDEGARGEGAAASSARRSDRYAVACSSRDAGSAPRVSKRPSSALSCAKSRAMSEPSRNTR